MDSGIETSPIPSFEPKGQNDLGVNSANPAENKLKGTDADNSVLVSVYDSNSETDYDIGNGDKQFLIPNPEQNTGISYDCPVPVSQYGSIQAGEDRESTSSVNTTTDSNHENLSLLQAQVFLEDAAMYRSIDHKVDFKSLKIYQFYHSKPCSWFRNFVILFLHMLAFFEFPSSLSWTSDIRTREDRVQFPCGVTETLELLCLLLLIADIALKGRIYGIHHLRTNKWLVVSGVVLAISLIDWSVSLSIGCKEVVRVRRMLRPIFIIQNSSLMKKILKSLSKTLSQILGVLLLMALHLYIFTLFGMLLFPKQGSTAASTIVDGLDIEGDLANSTSNSTQGNSESDYFRTLTDSFMSLLVLLTTANNPDVTLPAYRRNRLYALFFIVFLIIGLYCFMNMLTAIIYNQFRGYFLVSYTLNSYISVCLFVCLFHFTPFPNSISVSSVIAILLPEFYDYHLIVGVIFLVFVLYIVNYYLFYIISNGVTVRDLKLVVSRAKISQEMKVILVDTIAQGFTQDQMLSWNNFVSVLRMMEMEKLHREKPSIRWFQHHRHLVALQKIICHKYFSYYGNFMALINVILISFELATQYDKSLNSSQSTLRIINFLFIIYYVVEQSLIILCMGWRRYRYSWANLYDGSIVVILLLSELITVSLYGFPFFSNKETHGNFALWNIVRVINILIMFRLLRIIWHIKTMAIVAHTLLDLVKNLKSFGGILIVIYYFYAMLGMELFQDKITYPTQKGNVSESKCGTYEQLEYWANNFDDFSAAIVVLWDVMVVNNWFVFLDAYAKYTTKWSYLYFIVWWLTSVVIVLNLFTALILENFIMKWDKFYTPAQSVQRRRTWSNSLNMNTLTVHDIFKSNLKEPTEDEILQNMSKLNYFNVQT
ncbi:two pore channel protein 2-like [Ruditapes philippinarum]|uniref:two pore channel protein 2-like n=1 Tax=Ruditapes philippinarum TaxID=129788 RepID=UPI00295B7814|nr:two pore channel protein 2-like [Ruditapes philippinarum]